MFKKLLTAALAASILILPVSSAAPSEEAAPAPGQAQEDYLPGDVPAQTDAVESMSPALHGLLLAMLNHGTDRFDFSDSALTWEGLYNMLSLYGRLDSRCDEQNGELFLPEETILDYAAALAADPEALGEPPSGLRDRLNYDNISHCYLLLCGEDDLAYIQVDSLSGERDGLLLTGSLIYEVEEETLARFQAFLRPQDNMFGYAVTELSIIS